MSDKEKEELAKLEFLVIKSRNLLQEQFSSYDMLTNKAGILISISALFTPIAVTIISSSESSIFIRHLSVIPTVSMAISLTYLLIVLTNKKLIGGFNFEQFETQMKRRHIDLLKFEIGANKTSFNKNEVVIERRFNKFKMGIIFIYVSAICIFCLITANTFLHNNVSNEKKIEKIIIEQFNIN